MAMARILVFVAAVHLCTARPWKEHLEALLEIHPKSTRLWKTLGATGGGTVKGKHYAMKDCFRKALEVDPKFSGAGPVWALLGLKGGVTVKGKHYTPKECYQNTLELDPKKPKKHSFSVLVQVGCPWRWHREGQTLHAERMLPEHPGAGPEEAEEHSSSVLVQVGCPWRWHREGQTLHTERMLPESPGSGPEVHRGLVQLG